MRFTHLVVPLALVSSLDAQPNAVPGLDIGFYNIGSIRVYGRRGPAYPSGEAGIVIGHSMCNSGTVDLPWVGTSGSIMLDTYPKIAFLLARESDGRMVQISNNSFMKHSRVAYNFSSGPCAPCNRGSGRYFFRGCSDTYSPGYNGNRYNLGPTDEVDPWLASWDSQGTYFDRGDPAVTGSQATDRIQSLTSSQVSNFDIVKNRIQVFESELVTPGQFYGQVHLMIKGEPVGNRADNVMHRPLTYSWSGSSWTGSLSGTSVHGSVLTRWTGASTAMGGNGNDDGRFLVACKATGPVDGLWHYEYAVHNIDNARGGAALRIPICPNARVLNTGFRDTDDNALNQWTVSRSGSELSFLAAANNAQDWNKIFNFWFDSDAAPVAGNVTIDEALPGPGAPNVTVNADVPGQIGHEYLGAGCGTPAPVLFGNSLPSSPNPAYALRARTNAGSQVVFALSLGPDNSPLGNGCTLLHDVNQVVGAAVRTADASGNSSYSLPIPPGVRVNVFTQVVEVVSGGPLFGQLALSNGLQIRVGRSGCQ